MQFVDLKAQYTANRQALDRRIGQVLEHGRFISGPEVDELEAALCAYTGAKHCVACANGTDALELVLYAWGIGPGDAVFVPSFTFMSTAEVVAYLGATPVFVDIDPHTFNLSCDSLSAAIEAVEREGRLRPRAVIAVDLFGQPADYDRICALAAAHSLKLLEDGAQGFGGSIRGKRAGSFGDAATTSFFPAKPLGCYGDGGAVFTDDDALYALVRSLAVHGKGREKYDNVRIGRNSRLDTLQAAVLLAKLDVFDTELLARDSAAARYTAALSGVVQTPPVPEGYFSSWAQYTLTLPEELDRETVRQAMGALGVPTMVYYPKPLHLQQAFAGRCLTPVPLIQAERASRHVLSLPMHPYLTEADTAAVCDAVCRAAARA